MKTSELEAVIAQYVALEEVEEPKEEFKNNKEREEFVATCEEKTGLIAHQVTKEDLKVNPELKDKAKVGDFVLLPKQVDSPAEGKPEDSKEEDAPADKEPEDSKEEEDENEVVIVLKKYSGKIVTKEEDRIKNGRLYKEVTTIDGAITPLTVEEYEELLEVQG